MKINVFIFILILICILISFYIIYNRFNRFNRFNNNNNNKCNKEQMTNMNESYAIVVLTRGYESNDSYNDLIKRNESIYNIYYKNLENYTNYSVIIFNEGNITPSQQEYIQSKTPNMPLIFTTIKFYQNFNTNNDLCPPTELSNQFSMGYKNMCYFWSIDFLTYLGNYEYIIRIDEDCFIQNLDPYIIDNYKQNNIMFSSPLYQTSDIAEVVVGMDTLFNEYLQQNNLIKKNSLRMPYTNFMICNIPYFKNNILVMNLLEKIKLSNCIFSNRWGDLPIWGYILSYLIDSNRFIEDKSIKYFHGSHYMQINS
jgi:hypothetical protein